MCVISVLSYHTCTLTLLEPHFHTWGQNTLIKSTLSAKRDWGPKRVNVVNFSTLKRNPNGPYIQRQGGTVAVQPSDPQPKEQINVPIHTAVRQRVPAGKIGAENSHENLSGPGGISSLGRHAVRKFIMYSTAWDHVAINRASGGFCGRLISIRVSETRHHRPPQERTVTKGTGVGGLV